MRTPGCEEALEMLVKDKVSLKSWVKFYRYHILESDYAFGQKDDLREGELGINPNIYTHTHTHTYMYTHTHKISTYFVKRKPKPYKKQNLSFRCTNHECRIPSNF